MRRPTLEDRLEYAGVILFVKAARLLGAGGARWLGGTLGRVTFDVLRFRRGITLSNLREHLGRPASDREIDGLGRQVYMNFGMGLAEFARLPEADSECIADSMYLEGREHLDEALRCGKGGILVTGHFGSWELMGCVLVRLGYPISFVVGVQRNPLVQVLMNDLRKSCGIGIIEPTSLLAMTHALRENRFIAMLSDQDAGRRGIFVEFLGQMASTPQGAGRLAVMTGAPVIPGFIVREDGARQRIVITPPIYADQRSRKDQAAAQVTRAYTQVIEAYVRAHPNHWLWAHRRWKTQAKIRSPWSSLH
jgi:KDO2-lipid IV(A) lauroyltransferase